MTGSKDDTLRFEIVKSAKGDIPSIVEIINEEAARSGAVLTVDSQKVKRWIDSGISLLAKSDGKIIGHMAANRWPISGMVELRSSVVRPEYRGKGVSSTLTKGVIAQIGKKYGKPSLVAFINKAGNGRGILEALGFRETDYESVPRELFSIGPKYRGKKEFGYRILVLRHRE